MQRLLFSNEKQRALWEAADASEDRKGPWEGAEVIYSYSRRQAIEDGVLVQLSGPGYEGDDWVPKAVAEAGFRIPVAMTAAAFALCVELSPAAKRASNDLEGRLWDVLYMLRLAIGRMPWSAMGATTVWFDVYCVTKRVKPTLIRLKAVCGPGDDAEPVLTIMLPDED